MCEQFTADREPQFAVGFTHIAPNPQVCSYNTEGNLFHLRLTIRTHPYINKSILLLRITIDCLIHVWSFIHVIYPSFLFFFLSPGVITGSYGSDHQPPAELQHGWCRWIIIVLPSNASISHSDNHRLPASVFPPSIQHSSAIDGLPPSTRQCRPVFSSKPHSPATTTPPVPTTSAAKDTTHAE